MTGVVSSTGAWACRVAAYAAGPGRSPRHHQGALRARRADRAVDLATLACPGGA